MSTPLVLPVFEPLIGLSAFFTAMLFRFWWHREVVEAALLSAAKQLLSHRDLTRFEHKLARVGLKYIPNTGYCIAISDKLLRFVRERELQYHLGACVGRLLRNHNVSTDHGQTFWLVVALANDSGSPHRFMEGLSKTNEPLHTWIIACREQWTTVR